MLLQEYLVVVIKTCSSKACSNLLVDRMSSMDRLKIKEFFFKSNNELPNSSVSIREDLSLLICNQFC